MIRISTTCKALVGLCVLLCIAFLPFDPCLAQRGTEEPNVLPLSAGHVTVPGETADKTVSSTVLWEGEKYYAPDAITVLMEVIANPATDTAMRAKALRRLSTVRSRDTTVQLVALYDDLVEREEKLEVIRCLISSEDPRGFAMFARVLEYEEDNMVRLFAAIALARWNIRRGVAELIRFLDECKDYARGDRSFCNEAANEFRTFNAHKGWGFPADRIQRRIASRADVSDDEMSSLYITEIKKWFAENKLRFPDWKPGDPLPAAPRLPPMPPGPESVLSFSATFRAPPPICTVAQEKEEEVSCQGKRFPAREGVDLLMKAALEPAAVNDRLLALHRLEHLGSQLRNTQRIPQLMKLYGRVTDRSEKVGLLFCLARSKDGRALPLFGEILDTREEEYLRLPAAYGLALWNVRRGVRELIELLAVKQTESPLRYPGIISDRAADSLSRLNYWKSWWAPEAVLQAAVEARAEVHDKVLGSCHAELKKWFAENEHRFPDWKLGDPVPETPRPDKAEREGE